MKALFRKLTQGACIVGVVVFASIGRSSAQPSTNQTTAETNSAAGQIAALQLQLTNAWLEVDAIVNQPVTAYRRESGYDVWISSPGWFHPGAITPDFNNVDVRKTQEFPYKGRWVSSDITPTMMFRGNDLEFNAMTKLFYTNRDLPKKMLTEPEMLKINSLYRIIGHCQTEIALLQNPPEPDAAADTDSDTNGAAPPPKAIATIERIPRQTRILYGSIAIGTLLVLALGLRLLRRGSH